MTTIKFGDKEYRIKYGFEATMRSGILKKFASMTTGGNGIDQLESTIEILPELLLVGLQKFHSDEFGYDYKTGEGKEEQIDKLYGLLDDYFDGEGADFGDMISMLQKEMMENGFLAKLLQQEQAKAKKSTPKAIEEQK